MRSLYGFLGGALFAVLIVRQFPTSEQRYNARIGRYQMQVGKLNFWRQESRPETVFRIDTATGQTWYLANDKGLPGGEVWYAVSGGNDSAFFVQ